MVQYYQCINLGKVYCEECYGGCDTTAFYHFICGGGKRVWLPYHRFCAIDLQR